MSGILRSALTYSASEVALKALNFLLIPLYTRALTVEDYGILGFTQALGQVLAPILSLGIVGSLPILYHSVAPEQRPRLIAAGVNGAFLYGAGATLVFIALWQPLIMRWFDDVAFWPYVVLGLAGAFASSFYSVPLGVFNVQERTSAYATYSISLAVVGILLNILFVVVCRFGAVGSLIATLVMALVALFVALQLGAESDRRLDWSFLAKLLALSLPTVPHLLLGTLWRSSDRFVLTSSQGLAETGAYSLAMTVSSVVLLALNGVTTALGPRFYRRAAEGDVTLASEWGRVRTVFFFLAGTSGAAVALLAPVCVSLFTPVNYHSAAGVVPILALGQVLTALYWFDAPLINSAKKMWAYLAASAPAAVINVVANLVLVNQFGQAGAAWAFVGSAFVQMAVFGFFALRAWPVYWDWATMAKIGASVGGTVGLLSLIRLESLWVELVLKSVGLAGVVLLSARLFVFTREEFERGRRQVAALFRGLRSAS